MSGLKAIMPTAMVAATMVPNSSHWVRSNKCRLPAAHRTTKGATTSAPAKSPSHQVIQVIARGVGASPEKIRLPMPTIALMIVLKTQTNANLATPVVVANVSRPLHQLLINHAATSASSVLPEAIAAAAYIDPTFVTLAANDATSTAGPTR